MGHGRGAVLFTGIESHFEIVKHDYKHNVQDL